MRIHASRWPKLSHQSRRSFQRLYPQMAPEPFTARHIFLTLGRAQSFFLEHPFVDSLRKSAIPRMAMSSIGRFRGCLLGLAVGDAVGTAVESLEAALWCFHTTDTFRDAIRSLGEGWWPGWDSNPQTTSLPPTGFQDQLLIQPGLLLWVGRTESNRHHRDHNPALCR